MESNKNRKKWMGLLAKVPAEKLSHYFAETMSSLSKKPEFSWLRQPEIGGVMVQGRAGATGAAFNLGEMTVTRCSLKLSTGEVGHAYIQGRNKQKAEQAALVDAYMQSNQSHFFEDKLIKPIEAELALTRTKRAKKAAGTKVDFFTLVRGED